MTGSIGFLGICCALGATYAAWFVISGWWQRRIQAARDVIFASTRTVTTRTTEYVVEADHGDSGAIFQGCDCADCTRLCEIIGLQLALADDGEWPR